MRALVETPEAPPVEAVQVGRKWRIVNPNSAIDRSVVDSAVGWALDVWPADERYIDGQQLLADVRKRVAEGGEDSDKLTDDLVISVLRDRGVVIEEVS